MCGALPYQQHKHLIRQILMKISVSVVVVVVAAAVVVVSEVAIFAVMLLFLFGNGLFEYHSYEISKTERKKDFLIDYFLTEVTKTIFQSIYSETRL